MRASAVDTNPMVADLTGVDVCLEVSGSTVIPIEFASQPLCRGQRMMRKAYADEGLLLLGMRDKQEKIRFERTAKRICIVRSGGMSRMAGSNSVEGGAVRLQVDSPWQPNLPEYVTHVIFSTIFFACGNAGDTSTAPQTSRGGFIFIHITCTVNFHELSITFIRSYVLRRCRMLGKTAGGDGLFAEI